jgi:hypothetical protein
VFGEQTTIFFPFEERAMNADTLSAITRVLLSLTFSYIPGVQAHYEPLDGVYKRLIMLGLLALVATGAFSLACAGWQADLGLILTCDRTGMIGLLRALISALVANQTTYLISPIKQSRAHRAQQAIREGGVEGINT